MAGWRLVADVGGTNVRFARAHPDGRVDDVERWRTASDPTFVDALTRYVAGIGGVGGCDGLIIGAAGPVDGGVVHLTNGNWVLREAEISQALGGVPVKLLNDLEGIALVLPALEPDDFAVLGPVAAPGKRHAMLAVNVGTGFGAAAVFPDDGGWLSLPGEAGHMRLDSEDALRLGLDPELATIEDVLSGAGVLAIWRAVAGREPPPGLDADAVFAKADADAEAAEVACIFGDILGRVSGDLALAVGAWGGVFLCGGVVTGWFPHADAERFRTAFETKGKMTDRMAAVFTGRISRGEVALAGLARARFAG